MIFPSLAELFNKKIPTLRLAHPASLFNAEKRCKFFRLASFTKVFVPHLPRARVLTRKTRLPVDGIFRVASARPSPTNPPWETALSSAIRRVQNFAKISIRPRPLPKAPLTPPPLLTTLDF